VIEDRPDGTVTTLTFAELDRQANRLASARDTEPAVPVATDAPTTMLYTSGTTGRPKGAVRRPADPEALRPLLEAVGHRPDDVYITTGPLYHSGPGGYLGIAHRLGNTAVVQRRFDPEDWLRLVDRYRVTATFSASTPIRMVVRVAAHGPARSSAASCASRTGRSAADPDPACSAWMSGRVDRSTGRWPRP
jgi:fatty-acyl-CoA synthase/long-chain acyl-CoA synthetase